MARVKVAFDRHVSRERAERAMDNIVAAAFNRTDARPRFSIPVQADDDDVVLRDFIIATQGALAEARKYAWHDFDCAVAQRRLMAPVAEAIMEQVVGTAQCSCGYSEFKSRIDALLGEQKA